MNRVKGFTCQSCGASPTVYVELHYLYPEVEETVKCPICSEEHDINIVMDKPEYTCYASTLTDN